MAKRIVAITTITPTATADAATVLADNTYPFIIQGASSTQRTNILEIYMGGQAGASSPTFMLLARDSTIGATPGTFTSGTDAAMDPATAALAAPVVTNNAWTTKPQRSTTLKLMNLSFNAFGGIVKWNPGTPDQCPSIIGNTASLGECSLSAFTGGTPGAMGCHMVYETL